jgi:hypothetical protein
MCFGVRGTKAAMPVLSTELHADEILLYLLNCLSIAYRQENKNMKNNTGNLLTLGLLPGVLKALREGAF